MIDGELARAKLLWECGQQDAPEVRSTRLARHRVPHASPTHAAVHLKQAACEVHNRLRAQVWLMPWAGRVVFQGSPLGLGADELGLDDESVRIQAAVKANR